MSQGERLSPLPLKVTLSASTGAKVPGQRQDGLPPVIPQYERGQARKHGSVEQAVYTTHTTVARTVKVAGRPAPRVERGFDEFAVCRRHAIPLGLRERHVQPSVYRDKDVLDGHPARIMGCDNPVPQEEVGNDPESRDIRVYSQLSEVVGCDDLTIYASGMVWCVTDVPVNANWAEARDPSGRRGEEWDDPHSLGLHR